MIKIGYLQFQPELGQIENNLNSIKKHIASFKESIDILVLPELFNTGYYFTSKNEVRNLCEPANGPTYKFLKDLAEKLNCFIFGGFAEIEEDKLYNSSMLVSPNGKQWLYRKAHLFSEEKLFFNPSHSPLEPIELEIKGKKIKVGLMICFDWFFPETARTLALKGAQILLHTANLVMPYCPAATITRCLENKVFTVLCNRTGKDVRTDHKELSFIGLSRIVNPNGVVLTESNETEEGIKCVEIDPNQADNKQLNLYNNLFQDRRTDLYQL